MSKNQSPEQKLLELEQKLLELEQKYRLLEKENAVDSTSKFNSGSNWCIEAEIECLIAYKKILADNKFGLQRTLADEIMI